MLVVGYGEENGTKYWLIKVRAHAAQQRVWRMRPQHRVWRMHEVCLCVDCLRALCVCVSAN